ncbi:hypothetical protein [Pedomonas sp. V897]|uniref:hypothetical protein n=1 Tax=Pedomonas sp. V897 TaxID=3446482 RepID=UPI003EDF25DA
MAGKADMADVERDCGRAEGLTPVKRLLATVGALEGAAGVALAAVSAHAVPSPALGNAATLLMAHAGVVVALALIAAHAERRLARLLCLPAAILALGAGLFATAVAVRVLAAPEALRGVAPIGGSLTILGWLSLLPAALLGRTRQGPKG